MMRPFQEDSAIPVTYHTSQAWRLLDPKDRGQPVYTVKRKVTKQGMSLSSNGSHIVKQDWLILVDDKTDRAEDYRGAKRLPEEP